MTNFTSFPIRLPVSRYPHLELDGLVKWVGSRAPVGEEQAEANSFEDTADDSNSDSVDWAFFSDDLCDDLISVSGNPCCAEGNIPYTWGSASHEDQTAEVRGALVAQSTGSVDESGDTISLEGRSGERRAPAGSSGGGFL
jgi:hypothetical protein